MLLYDVVFHIMYSVENDGLNWEKSCSKSIEAKNRGDHMPELKLSKDDTTVKITPEPCHVLAKLDPGYYPMTSKIHGVALIINNEKFTQHKERKGTERDEYNLIETLRSLGYHVKVHRNVTDRQIKSIFGNIDKFLENVDSRYINSDSFICCILSHGKEFSIISSDSKEVKIDTLEHSLGKSKYLNSKLKIFFIQASR